MLAFIRGTIVELKPTHVILEANNVGYFINISLNTYSDLVYNHSENVQLFTHVIIKDETPSIFGFSTLNEQKIFRFLISVSGIGPNVARMILSSLSPTELVKAIINENTQKLQSIKGIGLKTAQRLIIELKDKILKTEFFNSSDTEFQFSQKNLQAYEEALAALTVLGFAKKQSENVIQKIINQNQNLQTEEIIRLALKML